MHKLSSHNYVGTVVIITYVDKQVKAQIVNLFSSTTFYFFYLTPSTFILKL